MDVIGLIDKSITYRYDQDEKNVDLLKTIYFTIISGDLKILLLFFITENMGRANYCPPLRFDEKWPKGGGNN